MTNMSPVLLAEAWLAWDRWARKLRDRRYRATAHSGEAVTARLLDIERQAADHLGISSTELHTEVVEGLRAGLSVTDSVTRVLASGDARRPRRQSPR